MAPDSGTINRLKWPGTFVMVNLKKSHSFHLKLSIQGSRIDGINLFHSSIETLKDVDSDVGINKIIDSQLKVVSTAYRLRRKLYIQLIYLQ